MGIVGLGALCELESDSPQQVSFRVSEHAVLEDGTEVLLHADRGFTVWVHGPARYWDHATEASIERDVRTVVLPDDAEETGEEHPWEWLGDLLNRAGVAVTADELRSVPYVVRLSPEVASRLRSDTGG